MKFALDTNIYVRAIRELAFGREVAAFYTRYSPRIHLCSVVLHELLIGATSPEKIRQIREDIVGPVARTKRIITPSHSAWDRAALALGGLAHKHGIDRGRMPRSLINDALLAVSCSEAGVVLLTDNTRDFNRLSEFVPLRYVQPWPEVKES